MGRKWEKRPHTNNWTDADKIAYYKAKAGTGTPSQNSFMERRLAQLMGVWERRPRRSGSSGNRSGIRSGEKFTDQDKINYYAEKVRTGTPEQVRHARKRLHELGAGSFAFTGR